MPTYLCVLCNAALDETPNAVLNFTYMMPSKRVSAYFDPDGMAKS